jgi:uncharacterized protein YjbI with pentapeptide repeats
MTKTTGTDAICSFGRTWRLFFDAFDEMADRVRWDITQANFQELRRAADGAGKVILTCRTHYFKDRTEQTRLIGQGPSLTAAETALYKELRQQSGAEVVYLQEFNDGQIQDYLLKTRGERADEDWQKIQSIYNLRDLAQRPLLLEMIVKTLPKLHVGQTLNAASLYTVYTNAWVDRDYVKGRIMLTNEVKLALMMELAWRMWVDEQTTFSTAELVQFVGQLHAAQALEFGDEEVEDIVREVQAASFLRRERDAGNFSFMHRSFGEFFLARKILATLGAGPTFGADRVLGAKPHAANALAVSSRLNEVLDTRRFDQKAIYFLTLLDEADSLCGALQSILTSAYTQNISENSLQILYWSGRVRCEMEEQIGDLEKLHGELAARLPAGAQLAGAQLQEVVLEGAVLAGADLSGADLTKANLNAAMFTDTRFHKATLTEARAERLVCERSDFRECDLRAASFLEARFVDCEFTGAQYDSLIQFVTAELLHCHDARRPQTISHAELAPVVQLGTTSAIQALAWSPDEDLLAVGGEDGVIRLYRSADGRLLRTLEGHKSDVTSVAFGPQGRNLASGKLLRTLQGHVGHVRSVCFAPTGLYLVAAGDAGRLQFWDWEQGETFLYLYAFGPGAWLALLPDGRFDGSPDALRWLCYTQRDTLNSFTAEELVHQFHNPAAVQEVLARYHVPSPA